MCWAFIIFLSHTLYQFTFLLIIILSYSLCCTVLLTLIYVEQTPSSLVGKHIIQAWPRANGPDDWFRDRTQSHSDFRRNIILNGESAQGGENWFLWGRWKNLKFYNGLWTSGTEPYCSTLTDKILFLNFLGRGGGEVRQLGKNVLKVAMGKDNLKTLRNTDLEWLKER